MISYETFSKIRHYRDSLGLSASQIAKALSLDSRTVIKWIDESHFNPRKPSPRASKIDPYKTLILGMLESHPYSAAQILQRIQEEGFDGGYSIIKEFVRKVRPRRAPAFLKLAFAPGECAQVDWGSFRSVTVGNTKRRLSFFVMVLCHSRLMYLQFTLSQTMEHFLACHQNAFQFFGAVPARIMVDNLKSAVLSRVVGEAPVFNPKYQDFANHYGFEITACAVAKGNEKGRVESGVGYVKKNFLNGLDIPHFAALEPAAKVWLNSIANLRTHGETRKRPLDLFQEQERAAMKPLNPNPYDIATIQQVRASSQFRITLDTNRYSVPSQYAGVRLILKIHPDHLSIYGNDKLIARHVRSYERHRDIENPDHSHELIRQRKNAREQRTFTRFLALSSCAEEYHKGLADRLLNTKQHVTKIVALSEIHGTDAVAEAMIDAIASQAFSSTYVDHILAQRAKKTQEPGTVVLTRRQDLLDLEVQRPDLAIYETTLEQRGETDL